MQVLRGPRYKRLSDENRIKLVPIKAPRGRIFDRNGKLLVDNSLSFNLAVIPQELGDKGKTFNKLAGLLNLPSEELEDTYRSNYAVPFAPVVIKRDLTREDAFYLEEMSSSYPGVTIQPSPRREYVYAEKIAHITGYLGNISSRELAKLKDYGYEMTDFVGKDGIEKYFDTYLRGTDGGMQIEVDNKGRRLRVLGVREPVPGKDLRLTVDMDLQEAVYGLIKEKKAAAVVMDSGTGQILAMVSAPSYDPNIFVTPGMDRERIFVLRNGDKKNRLTNRAIRGSYPPGSVFKVIVGAAALQTGKISKETSFECTGIYELGGSEFKCWKLSGHGMQNIREAIKNSCNVFFYNTGRRLGVDRLSAYASRFGLGKPTGVDLPHESSGLVPNRIWKRVKKREPWYEGETVNYSIGQGYLLATPIQILCAVNVFAARGSYFRPYLVSMIEKVEISKEAERRVGISEENLKIIREGMFGVVDDPHGTGQKAKVADLKIAGKTGTAQAPGGEPHAWFAGFCPYDKSKITVLVFVEHGGSGGLAAAELAAEIFKSAKSLGVL
jgi:penicillin-binding protein 2